MQSHNARTTPERWTLIHGTRSMCITGGAITNHRYPPSLRLPAYSRLRAATARHFSGALSFSRSLTNFLSCAHEPSLLYSPVFSQRLRTVQAYYDKQKALGAFWSVCPCFVFLVCVCCYMRWNEREAVMKGGRKDSLGKDSLGKDSWARTLYFEQY
jgi:hypothetical protein